VQRVETFKFEAVPGNAVAACGPVTVSTDQLTNPRAFKHQYHPLDRHADAFASVTGCSDGVETLRDRVWRQLVVSYLLPAVGVGVQLSAGSYNSTYARFVDGLTNNEQALAFTEVVVPAEAVEAAFATAAAAADTDPAVGPDEVARTSTLTDGLAALVGRRVEVAFGGAVDAIVGQLVAVHPDALVVAASEAMVVVPLGAVAYVSTWQLTDDEDRALFD
jgi:hypothetical protein